jgi:thiosulfate/3-mercaptopyruvate sulfurtransferase
MTNWTTLVSAEELAAQLGRDGLVVIDARAGLADPDAGAAAYAQSHIPGARYAHLDHDLSDHRKRNAGRHPWPEAADFTAALERWGVSPEDQVVAYDHGDGALAAARLWALLRLLGHRRVAVLDGGWQRWNELGLPTDDALPTPPTTRYPGSFDQNRLLDADAVRAHLDAGGLLIDARAAERFRGEVEPLDRVAGHVPGARNRPYAQNLQQGRFKPVAELAEGFAAVMGDYPPQQTVVMCGSGVTACHHLLAMEHAGLPGAGLFTGSWSGWVDDPSRPVATGEA